MSGQQGWIPESYDPRDKPYRSTIKGKMEQSVDLSKDHPEWLQAIYHQVSTGSCVANATAAAYRFAAKKQKAGRSDVVIMDDPSRLFIYYNARILPALQKKNITVSAGNAPKDPPFTKKMFDPEGGSENRDSFKGMNLYGVCDENTWPWKNVDFVGEDGENDKRPEHLNDVPSDDAYKKAKASQAVEYCRLDPDHPPQVEKAMTDEERQAVGIVSLMQLKQCLSEGYPVVLGFWFYENKPWGEKDCYMVLNPVPKEYVHKGPPRDEKGTALYGGHTVLCIGYDNSRSQILCQNSWGEGWSQKGKFWMPYSYVSDWEATDDFWMVRLIEAKKG